jgi:hypothetical protein
LWKMKSLVNQVGIGVLHRICKASVHPAL